MTTKLWLSRRLIDLPMYYALCTKESQFYRLLKTLGAPKVPYLSSSSANATTHFLETGGATSHAAIVCLQEKVSARPVEVYGLLVHEAVHIKQEAFALIGEKSPGDEIEAYTVQSISQALIDSYLKQTRSKKT